MIECRRVSTGELIESAIFTDMGDIVKSGSYVSKIEIDGVPYYSEVVIPPGTPHASSVRFITDSWNFMQQGFLILA